MERKYKTNYKVATKWCNNNYVMCNHISEIDPTIWDNMRFELGSDGEVIYQYFISDCSECDVDFLQVNFGLKFTYSELLECYILCVDHYGTSWDYVYCATSCEAAQRELGEDK